MLRNVFWTLVRSTRSWIMVLVFCRQSPQLLKRPNEPFLDLVDARNVACRGRAGFECDPLPRFIDLRGASVHDTEMRRRVLSRSRRRTTGGARSGTRTTTVLLILMMNAATRTGESNPRTSRYRSLRGPISFPLLLLFPSSHMVTKTESTHE